MIKTYADLERLSFGATEKFIRIGNAAIGANGRFTIALAGGSTPKSLYRLLASEPFKNQIDWKKVFFFFGDERNVSPDDEASNFRMANENLFAPLRIAGGNIFRWETERRDAEITAFNYEYTLRKFFDAAEITVANFDDFDLPRFDLILLGIGADGHTASLFPFTEALNETKRIAVANRVEKLNTTRLTVTFPVINSAANVIFLVSGAEKSETVKEILQGEAQPERFPAQSVRPETGNLFWLLDEKAAALLK